jgi:hypothetical protein
MYLSCSSSRNYITDRQENSPLKEAFQSQPEPSSLSKGHIHITPDLFSDHRHFNLATELERSSHSRESKNLNEDRNLVSFYFHRT